MEQITQCIIQALSLFLPLCNSTVILQLVLWCIVANIHTWLDISCGFSERKRLPFFPPNFATCVAYVYYNNAEVFWRKWKVFMAFAIYAVWFAAATLKNFFSTLCVLLLHTAKLMIISSASWCIIIITVHRGEKS